MSLIVHIRKRLHNFELISDFETDGQLALLGASGSGKSMTLKCIAGIEKPDSGYIELNGRVLYDSSKHINIQPQKRNVVTYRTNIPEKYREASSRELRLQEYWQVNLR